MILIRWWDGYYFHFALFSDTLTKLEYLHNSLKMCLRKFQSINAFIKAIIDITIEDMINTGNNNMCFM